MFRKSVLRKRSIRRRKSKLRYAKRKRTTLVNKSLTPFASRFITQMKYSESYLLSSSNNYTQIMNLNSIFDPNRTGIGHQPYGRDQLDQIYNRYRVIKCSFVINGYSTTGDPIRLVALPTNDVLGPTYGASELVENPRARWIVQMPGGSTQYLKNSVYIPALMGRSKAQYMADDRFQATQDTSPAEAALLYIVTGAMNGDIAVNTHITVTLKYTVEFFDPKPIDQS